MPVTMMRGGTIVTENSPNAHLAAAANIVTTSHGTPCLDPMYRVALNVPRSPHVLRLSQETRSAEEIPQLQTNRSVELASAYSYLQCSAISFTSVRLLNRDHALLL